MAIINQKRQFDELIADDPVKTGVVQSFNMDGTSNVLMTGGGTIRAFGQGVSIGNTALVQGDTIIGEAQNLPAFNLEV